MPVLHAIVLAGGRAQRMGGVDKVLTVVRGRSLLAGAVGAVASAEKVAVVGPRRDVELPRDVIWTREEPEFGGPAAGIGAGWSILTPAPDDEILVLPADLVNAAAVVAALTSAGMIAADPGGRRQWACVRVRAADLGTAISNTGDLSGLSLRAFLDPLHLTEVAVSHAAAADLDTPDDAKEYADEYR